MKENMKERHEKTIKAKGLQSFPPPPPALTISLSLVVACSLVANELDGVFRESDPFLRDVAWSSQCIAAINGSNILVGWICTYDNSVRNEKKDQNRHTLFTFNVPNTYQGQTKDVIQSEIKQTISQVTLDNLIVAKPGSNKGTVIINDDATIKNVFLGGRLYQSNTKGFGTNDIIINAKGKITNLNIVPGAHQAKIQVTVTNPLTTLRVQHQGSLNLSSTNSIDTLYIHQGSSTIAAKEVKKISFLGQGGTLTLNNGTNNTANNASTRTLLILSNTPITLESGTHTLNARGTINNLTFSGTGGTLTLNNDLSISNASATVSSGNHTLNANNNNGTIKTLTFQGQGGSLNLANGPKVEAVSITSGTSIMQASDIKDTMPTFNQTGGSFTLISNKPVTSYTQSGGTANITAQNATITSYTQSGGTANITAQNATITSYTQSGGTANLKTSIQTYNQTGGTAFVQGSISQYTLGASSTQSQNATTSYLSGATSEASNATLENFGSIENMIISASTSANIINYTNINTLEAQHGKNIEITNYGTLPSITAEANTHTRINNEGIIRTLTHKGDGMYINMRDRFSSIDNIIQEGTGAIELTSLDNVAQSEGISLLTIKNSGGIYVHTMHASLDGNKGKPRVTISNGNGSSSSTSNGKLTVERIVINQADGNFNPLAHISATLKDYVTNGTSNTNNISTTNPKMYASQELRDIGIDFYEDGSPKSSANGSLAATLSSLIITQSMRRKLLTDIYLAEQNQASLQKGSEKSVLLSNPTIAKYQKDKAQYDKEIKEWHKLANTPKNKKIIASYEKERAIYEKEKAAYDKAKASKKKSKNLKAPKAPIKPDIIAKRPHLPTNANIDKEVLASLESGVHDVSGDFFIRALGSEGDYNLENGTQTNSYSVGAMLGGGKSIAISSGYGNIGFYGGYEYTNNGYKDSSGFNIDSNIGFAGVRFSHLFLQSKAAGLYYVIDAHGGYGRANLNAALIRDELAYQSSVNLYSYGTTLRLGSTIYLDGVKSILVPSVGAGLDGGMLGAFAMQPYTLNNATMPTHPLRFGSDAEIYNLGYAQANLNYYQALGKSMAMTIGGGARYLLNNDIDIKALINDISLQGTLSLSPLYYYGSAMLSLYASSLGNLSAGYTYIQGGIGKTHNASLRWHYFF